MVDDRSTDATADVARARGARVVRRAPSPPPGWVGKPWALQQGLEAAAGESSSRSTPTRARGPGSRARSPTRSPSADLVTAGTRFDCDRAGERLLHPRMLATLVYRFGPVDARAARRGPHAGVANGQCLADARASRCSPRAASRRPAGHMTDDIALARALPRARLARARSSTAAT